MEMRVWSATNPFVAATMEIVALQIRLNVFLVGMTHGSW